MTNDPVFDKEAQHTEATVQKVRISRKNLEKSMEAIGAFNLERLKKLRENPEADPSDFLAFLQLLDEKNAALNIPDKYKQLDELTYLEKEPYFSRIDLKDKGVLSTYYIGKFGFTQEKPVIIDWRASIASVYYKYRYPQKNVEYGTLDGKKVIDLTLKRTFEIDNGKLIRYYNNDIQLDEKEILIGKVEKRTGGVLEDIVETIQQSQLEVIQSDPRRVCIVQGAVGSGKSTVAIHKLSYIFFNYPNLIKPEKSVLIAKNQVLVGYLSTLFPKLGIFDINYGTVRDVLYKLNFLEEINLPLDLDQKGDFAAWDIKKIYSMQVLLHELHSLYEKKVEEIFDQEEFITFGGYQFDKIQPIDFNLKEIFDDLNEEMKMQKEHYEANPNSARAPYYKRNMETLKKLLRKIGGLRTKLKNQEVKKLYKKLGLKEKGIYGLLDALAYVTLHLEILGFKKFEPYQYCVVDEGQDFSLLEYYFLNKIVIKGRFTILGDLNQGYDDLSLKNWEQIFEIVKGAKEAALFELKTNYRSTVPIVMLANNILRPFTQSYLPLSIGRKGLKPVIKSQQTFNDVVGDLKSNLENDLKNIKKSIGIICFNSYDLEKIDQIIAALTFDKNLYIKLEPKRKAHYNPNGLYLTSFEDCKGLEFSKVYILGLDLEKVDSFTKAKKAFVSVTRAMNEVVIYSYDS